MNAKVITNGDALYLTLPDSTGFEAGQRWLLIASADEAAYTLVPRLPNPYADDGTPVTMTEAWPDVRVAAFE